MNGEKRIGLMIGRFQPLHRGHTRVIGRMLEECHQVVIGIGSCNRDISSSNPWSPEDRIAMLTNVFGQERINIIKLEDQGFEAGTDGWVNYIFNTINEASLPMPTDYYTGSFSDSIWYRNHFWYAHEPYDSTLARPSLYDEDTFHDRNGQLRKLHIINRVNEVDGCDEPVSATAVREYLSLRHSGWHNMVPFVNHGLVTERFPSGYMVPLSRVELNKQKLGK